MDSRRGHDSLAACTGSGDEAAEGTGDGREGLARRSGSGHASSGGYLQEHKQGRGDIFNLHGGQEGISGSQTSRESSVGQSTHQHGTLQDDNDERRKVFHHSRMLHGEDRPQGLFLAVPGQSEGSSGSLLQVERRSVLLSGTSLWSQCQPHDYHQAFQASDSSSPTAKSSTNDIHRRYADIRRHKRAMREGSVSDTVSLRGIGSSNKHQKVVFIPIATDGLPRIPHRLQQDDYLGSSQEASQHQEGTQEVPQSASFYSAGSGFNSRQDKFTLGRTFSDTCVHQRSPGLQNQYFEERRLGPEVRSFSGGSSGRELVDRQHLRDERTIDSSPSPDAIGRDGRFGLRMGRMDKRPDDWDSDIFRRDFRQGDGRRTYQLQGTHGSELSDFELSSRNQTQSHGPGNRQHDLSSLHSEVWWSKNQTVPVGRSHLDQFEKSARNHLCQSYSRSNEQSSGLRVSPVPHRQQSSSCLLSSTGSSLGAPLNRRVLDVGKQATAALCELETQPDVHVGGQHGSSLGQRERLGEPTFFHAGQDPSKGEARGDRDYDRRSVLASSGMVPSSLVDVDTTSISSSRMEKSISLPRQLPREQDDAVGDLRMEDLGAALKARGISQQVIGLLLKSWDSSTSKQYAVIWATWVDFAKGKGVGPFDASDARFAEWVSVLIANGLSQSTVEKYKSVVGQTMELVNGENPSTSILVRKLATSAGKVNKAKVSKCTTGVWDVSSVFDYFHDISHVTTSLKFLIDKIICVGRSVLGWRSSDFNGVYRELGMTRTADGINMRFFDGKKGKNKWSGYTFIPRLADRWKNLCIARMVDLLIHQTKDLNLVQVDIKDSKGVATKDTPLLISVVPDKASGIYGPVKDSTVASKFKCALFDHVKDTEDGIPWSRKWDPHSVRNAVASLLSDMDVPVEKIAKHLQTSAPSLSRTYITVVHRNVPLPPSSCFTKQSHLVAKLLVPFVHYKTSSADGSSCGCDSII